MKRIKIFGNDTLIEKIISGLAVSIFAAVIFVYFSAQNTNELSLRTIKILSLILFSLSAITYAVFLIIFRRAFTAFVFCVVFWLGFHLMPLLEKFFSTWHGTTPFTTLILTVAFLSAILSRRFHNTMKFVYMFIAVMAVVFVMNFSVLIRASIQETKANNTPIPIKKDFVIEDKTQSPNIYWIHTDGMLSFETVKKYYGEDQAEFLSELTERNFIINAGANFEAQHHTAYAIPILMNPYSYDNWIKDVIFSDSINQYSFFILRNNSELQYAFSQKNYSLNIIGIYGYYYPVSKGNLWLIGFSQTRKQIFSHQAMRDNWLMEAYNFNNTYLKRLISFMLKKLKLKGQDYQVKISNDELTKIFENGFDDSDSQLDFVEALNDVLYGDYKQPRLTIIHNNTPHYPYVHSEDGTKIKDGDTRNPLDYYSQHKWSAKVLINIIDMILKVDPDSVIVIQSDHGLHGNTEEDFYAAFGEKANAQELWNSTMSAIRVPSKYRNGEESYAMKTPLNITRYLVNNFVGKNYEYLTKEIEK